VHSGGPGELREASQQPTNLEAVTTTPRPGWYPDPADDATSEVGYRWWDGTTWTDHTADHAYAPSPDDVVGVGPPRRQSRMVRAVAWTVVVALVLTTSAGALLLLWSGPPPSGSGRQPDEAAASVGGQLDERARRASIGPVTMDLPPSPYKVSSGTHQVPGVLDVVFVAEATVHQRTEQHSGWTAMTCLASVNERLADDFDLDEDSVATVRELAGRIYGSAATEVEQVDVSDHAVDGHSGVRVTARVSYRVTGLPSRYDDVTAILVRLDDGSVVVAFSSVPDDASKQIRTLTAASLDSLRVN
jgi:hypothetical protein